MKTVLLVEDTIELREAMSIYLERAGFNVVATENGREALRVLNKKEEQIDLIVTDLNMPVMNGKELVRRLMEKKCEIPIIMWSGEVDVPELEGVKWFVHKEKPKQVITVVKMWLDEPKAA